MEFCERESRPFRTANTTTAAFDEMSPMKPRDDDYPFASGRVLDPFDVDELLPVPADQLERWKYSSMHMESMGEYFDTSAHPFVVRIRI